MKKKSYIIATIGLISLWLGFYSAPIWVARVFAGILIFIASIALVFHIECKK